MNKKLVCGWVSALVVGALAVGCGHRGDSGSNKPQAVTPVACAPVAAAAAPTTPVAPVASQNTMAATSQGAAAPAPKVAEKPAKKQARSKVADAPLGVRRLVVAEGVERGRREPVGAASSFKLGNVDRLYAFVEVENPARSEAEVFVTFEPADNGASQGQVSLDVGAAPRWRTWAYTRGVKKAGIWAAVVRSSDGTVLARTRFEVTL